MTDMNLLEIAERRGPFAVVYMDASPDLDDAAQPWDLRCRSIRERLVTAGASQGMLDQFDRAITDSPPRRGWAGRLLILDENTVHADEYLPEPPAREVVRVSALPYLIPLLRQHASAGSGPDTRRQQQEVLDTFATEFGREGGLAVAGLGATADALRMANVDRLLIDPDRLGDRTVLVGADRAQVVAGPDGPASWTAGTAPHQTCRADEALPVAALLMGAEVTTVSGGLPSEDGVAALVRQR
ncbi:hypothetical protein ACFVAV_14370 [Nocardia sp. NPDC057663]|uniref:hypothetical protein n=1 Tax=Nocardia sp. NPDC057663 TaxID=3346201 RepID=UPI00366F7083